MQKEVLGPLLFFAEVLLLYSFFLQSINICNKIRKDNSKRNCFMKVFLIILIALALIIAGVLLLGVRISLKVQMEKEIKTALYLFGKELPNKGTLQKIIKKLGFKRTLELLFSKELGIWRRLGYVLKKLTITKFSLNATVASDDAAQTALLYGAVCGVLFPVVGFLETVMDFKEDNMKIVCDYEQNSPCLYFFGEVRIRVIYLIIAVFKIIPEIKRILKEVNTNEQ